VARSRRSLTQKENTDADAADVQQCPGGSRWRARFEKSRLADVSLVMNITFWGTGWGEYFLPMLKREERAHIANLSERFWIDSLPRVSLRIPPVNCPEGGMEACGMNFGDAVRVSCAPPGGNPDCDARPRVTEPCFVRERDAEGDDVDRVEKLFRTSPEDAARRVFFAALSDRSSGES